MPVNVCSIKLSEPKYCRPSSLRWSLTQMADRNENGNYKNYKHNLQENWKGVCLRRQQWGTAKERVRRQRVLWLLCEEGRGCCLERECLREELLPHPCSQDGSGFMSGALVVPPLSSIVSPHSQGQLPSLWNTELCPVQLRHKCPWHNWVLGWSTNPSLGPQYIFSQDSTHFITFYTTHTIHNTNIHSTHNTHCTHTI